MKNRYIHIFNTLVSAFLFIFSFPGKGPHFLIWFALVPLFFSISSNKGNPFKNGFYAGIIIYSGSLLWLIPTLSIFGGQPFPAAIASILLLGTYLAIYTGIFSILFKYIENNRFKALFLVPFAWTGLDFLVSFLFTGFPWIFTGYTQYQNILLIQISSITGVYGLTYYIIFINTAIFLILKSIINDKKVYTKANLITLLIISLLTASIFSYSFINLKNVKKNIGKSDRASILLLQANILPDDKHSETSFATSLKKYFSMTSKHLHKYDLAVWPETALPFPIFSDKELIYVLKQNAKSMGNQLIGTIDLKITKDNNYIIKNRAVLFSKELKTEPSYDKIHLVPFGEYIPLKKYLPFLAKFIVPAGEFKPGDHNDTIDIENMRIGTKICFEIIFPNLVRDQVQNGANILVNMTNDAWFGKTAGPHQHLAISVFRAVENSRSIARCANTGISAHILPTGEIIKKADLFKEKALNCKLPLMDEKTIYTKYGDCFAYICLVVLLSLGFFQFLEQKKNKENY